VSAHGILPANFTFIAFKRDDASSPGCPPDRNATPGTAAGTARSRHLTVACFEAGDHVEQFLVDAALAQAVEGAVEVSSNSSMFLSARCIAARRLAFSLARDSAQARKSEMKRYSRMSARSVVVPPPMTSGKVPVGQGTWPDLAAIASSGSNRWLTGS
jgi:hypothetical protein